MDRKHNLPLQPSHEEIRRLMALYFEGLSSPDDELILLKAANDPDNNLPDDLKADLEFIRTLNNGLTAYLEENVPAELEQNLARHINRLSSKDRFRKILRLSVAAAVACIIALTTVIIYQQHDTEHTTPALAQTQPIQDPILPETDKTILAHAVEKKDSLQTDETMTKNHLAQAAKTKKRRSSNPISSITTIEETMNSDEEELDEAVDLLAATEIPDDPETLEHTHISELVIQTTVPPISTLSNAFFNLSESLETVSRALSTTFMPLSEIEEAETEKIWRWRDI